MCCKHKQIICCLFSINLEYRKELRFNSISIRIDFLLKSCDRNYANAECLLIYMACNDIFRFIWALLFYQCLSCVFRLPLLYLMLLGFSCDCFDFVFHSLTLGPFLSFTQFTRNFQYYFVSLGVMNSASEFLSRESFEIERSQTQKLLRIL